MNYRSQAVAIPICWRYITFEKDGIIHHLKPHHLAIMTLFAEEKFKGGTFTEIAKNLWMTFPTFKKYFNDLLIPIREIGKPLLSIEKGSIILHFHDPEFMYFEPETKQRS